MKEELKKYALDYIKKGIIIVQVFDIETYINDKGEIKKKPFLPPWGEINENPENEAELERRFNLAKSIAVRTGKISNLTVLDIDCKNFPELGKLPPTFTTVTRKGLHKWYKHTDKVTQTQNQAKNVDIRSDGGLIFAPPTKYLLPDGTETGYEIAEDLPFAEFPVDWYFDYLKRCPFQKIEGENRQEQPREIFDYSSALYGVEDGGRNNLAVRTIGHYLGGAKTEEDFKVAWEATKIWNTQNKPPIRESELKKKFEYYKNKEAKKNKNAGDVFTRIGQAKLFIDKQPIYFSPEGLLWFWNFDRYCYELKDETDLLNGIRKEMNVDTVGSGNRTQILNALKQVGREQAPQVKPKGWIQFNDVLIDPKTLERVKADHRYLLTNPIPHRLGESEETPEIDRLLREWVIKDGVQDESYVQSLYEYLAYALTDDKFMQRIIALTGGGSNGKTTFLGAVKQLIGRYNCISVDIKKLSTNNFAMSSVYKKLVAFAGEVGYKDLANTNVLKKITGEDLIEYEFKGKTSFTDDCITTFFIATNSLPTTPDKTLGFYRRWVITDFPNIFDIKADILSKISEKEYENLCLKCVNILKGLYETHKFTNEGNYEERERKYEERSNPLPTFIEENCEEEAGCKIKLQEFGNKFNAWLKSKRLRVMTTKQIGEQLRTAEYTIGNRGFENEPNTTSKAILNLKWKQQNTKNTGNTVP